MAADLCACVQAEVEKAAARAEVALLALPTAQAAKPADSLGVTVTPAPVLVPEELETVGLLQGMRESSSLTEEGEVELEPQTQRDAERQTLL